MDIESALNAQIDKQVSRAYVTVTNLAEDATGEEDESLTDEVLAILLLLLLLRGNKVYNAGVLMALAASLSIDKTTSFSYSTSNADRAYTKGTIQSFNKDTSNNIAKILASGISSGLSADEIKQQLNGFKATQSSRVKRFSQNEAWRASEIAGITAMKQLDSQLNSTQLAGTFKTWNVQPGACPICLDYAGMTIKIDELFLGSFEAPPAHVTCRCKLSYSMIKGDNTATNRIEKEIHCSSCDRFLGTTAKDSIKDKLKCSNSACRALEVPQVRLPKAETV